jgi:hypothetical protein
VGIDTNAQVLRDNESYYGKGTWINDDWLAMKVSGLRADLFLSMCLIEHCESFQPFLRQMMTFRSLKYAVITFHKGLRDKEVIRLDRLNSFFDNLYCRADVERWLNDNLWNGEWNIFTLPLSRSPRMRKSRWDSVLVIDWTGNAKLDMWEKRNVTS